MGLNFHPRVVPQSPPKGGTPCRCGSDYFLTSSGDLVPCCSPPQPSVRLDLSNRWFFGPESNLAHSAVALFCAPETTSFSFAKNHSTSPAREGAGESNQFGLCYLYPFQLPARLSTRHSRSLTFGREAFPRADFPTAAFGLNGICTAFFAIRSGFPAVAAASKGAHADLYRVHFGRDMGLRDQGTKKRVPEKDTR